MKPASFVRHVPRTIEEALAILADVAPKDGRVLAGGQSLVPIMAFRMARPAHMLRVNRPRSNAAIAPVIQMGLPRARRTLAIRRLASFKTKRTTNRPTVLTIRCGARLRTTAMAINRATKQAISRATIALLLTLQSPQVCRDAATTPKARRNRLSHRPPRTTV